MTDVFQGASSRAYAALTFEYETSLRPPGEPPALSAPKVTIAPPDNLSISRYSFGGDKAAPLGGSKDPSLDRLDDSSVYTKQAEQAGDAAGARLAAALGSR